MKTQYRWCDQKIRLKCQASLCFMKANIHDNCKPDPRFNIVINFDRTMKCVEHNILAYLSFWQHHKGRCARSPWLNVEEPTG